MKKIIYGGLFLAVIGTGILLACNKEVQQQHPAKAQTNQVLKGTTTRRILSDADLISAIKGQTPEFVNLSDLEDLLYENARLDDNVISTLIETSRVPDFIVETALVLSAPVSPAELSHLSTKRPTLSATAIVAAAAAKSDANYVVINTNPRQVLFGKGMVKTSACDGCGEGTITTQSDHLLINLTSVTSTLDPAAIKPCRSGNTEWVCGTAVYVHLTGTDGTTAHFSVSCEQSSDKCIQNVQDARNK